MRKRSKVFSKVLIICIFSFLMLAALSGCKKLSRGNMLTIAINSPTSIDPYNCCENEGTQVCTSLFDGLLAYDFQKDTLVPRAAESWEQTPDCKTFTFHLVHGALFSNGEPVTSASFKRGWERLVNPNTAPNVASSVTYHASMVEGYQEMLEGESDELTGLTCPDDYTFVVHLSEPYADFPYVTTHPALSPVPSCALDDFESFFRCPIGNGPFKMDGNWVDGQYIDVVKNDLYYGEAPKVDAIEFVIEKDNETAFRELTAGNIDIAQVPPAQIEAAKEKYGTSLTGYTITPSHQYASGEKLGTTYLNINLENPKFSNPNVRRALSLAINRKVLVKNALNGNGAAADSIVPPSLAGYEEEAWKYATYNLEEADALLEKVYPRASNGSRTLSFSIAFDANANIKPVLEAVQSDFQKLGITVSLEQYEHATLISKELAGEYEVAQSQWIADYPILDNYIYPLFSSVSADNHSRYKNALTDAEIMQARALMNEAERIKELQKINRTIGSDVPTIPLYFQRVSLAGSKRIQYFYVEPSTNMITKTAELVTSETESEQSASKDETE